MHKLIVLFGIDVETDIGSFTPFYNGVEKGMPLLLDLFEKKGIAATFFFVAEAAQKFPELTIEVKKRGFEIGCHTIHHETVGDALFEIPLVRPILPEEVPLRLLRATEMIADVIGETPKSFRSPRLWGSTAVVNTLESLGYLADASYPLYFYRERLSPYHPSRYDWTKEGDLKILEIPNFADITVPSNDPYGRDLDQWPLFRTEGASVVMQHIENFVSYISQKGLTTCVLCFYFHPWEFVEMPSRIFFGEATVEPSPFITKNCGSVALNELSNLIDLLKGKEATFVSASELVGIWGN